MRECPPRELMPPWGSPTTCSPGQGGDRRAWPSATPPLFRALDQKPKAPNKQDRQRRRGGGRGEGAARSSLAAEGLFKHSNPFRAGASWSGRGWHRPVCRVKPTPRARANQLHGSWNLFTDWQGLSPEGHHSALKHAPDIIWQPTASAERESPRRLLFPAVGSELGSAKQILQQGEQKIFQAASLGLPPNG